MTSRLAKHKNKQNRNVLSIDRHGFLTPLKRFSEKSIIKIKSPAKVNLILDVVSKRKDGYHNLETIMVPVSLCDNIEIAGTMSNQIEIISNNKDLPTNSRNIIHKAVKLLQNKTGIKKGVIIKLNKKIPIAAGLGGGSSNGASVLLALNKLWKTRLTRKQLMEIGKTLGADVPFFIYGKTALAKGIGEKIYPIKIKRDFWSILINPGFPVSTAWVYRNLNLALTKKAKDNNKLISLLKKGEHPDLWGKYLFNDLENVTLQKFPVLTEIKKAIMESGALNVLMSGSGPSVFGVFASRDKALIAYNNLKKKGFGSVFLVKNL